MSSEESHSQALPVMSSGVPCWLETLGQEVDRSSQTLSGEEFLKDLAGGNFDLVGLGWA